MIMIRGWEEEEKGIEKNRDDFKVINLAEKKLTSNHLPQQQTSFIVTLL